MEVVFIRLGSKQPERGGTDIAEFHAGNPTVNVGIRDRCTNLEPYTRDGMLYCSFFFQNLK